MRAKDYPEEYREIFADALKGEVTFGFTSNAKAVAFRVELYKYRYAVRDELPSMRKHYDNIMKVRMSIKGKTLTLTAKKRPFVEKINDHK